MKVFKNLLMAVLLTGITNANAVETERFVSFQKSAAAFPLSADGKVAALLSSDNDWPGVTRAFKDFRNDLKLVTGSEARWATDYSATMPLAVIAGTIGRSKYIDQLIKAKKIDVSGVAGKWEASLTQVVDKPFPGVDRALVIAGSDKRGTIFGIYTLSAQIGVSPWYWWADVPVVNQKNIFVTPGKRILKEPAVKYRGIFLNDEAPALTGWAKEKFGGLNSRFYVHVFELILRLKANYLWPAMWGNAFNDDDKMNPVLADEYGIVMGTSHHEPMVRSQQEWKRFGKGEWNYQTNDSLLRAFWREGIRNMGTKESVVTIAMRGDGDEPMTEGSNIALLERIVKDQRQIIEEVSGKKAPATPQLWALYKEVQDYYDKGMRVPDDVTLLLCDDNWGNLRKLPSPGEKRRSGGYGIYYHFDYVGGPRSYRWLNTNPISKIQEQMHLAHQYGADRIWIVNVGDLKPMEFPVEFFLDYAYDPEKWPAERLAEYTRRWAEMQFGAKYATQIAEVISDYTRFNGRRKPELLSPATYSLVNYREFERIAGDYKALEEKALKIAEELRPEYQDAYFQLVLHPVQACANLNELYYTVGKNRLYAKQGRAATNDLADRAQSLFERDKALSAKYNREISGGKWNHMMDQTHISYVSWDNPRVDVLPEVKKLEPVKDARIGLAIEGMSDELNASANSMAVLHFDTYNRRRYIEIFNKGQESFDYTIKIPEGWLQAEASSGTIGQERRVWLEADWNRVPAGKTRVPVTVSGSGGSYIVYADFNKSASAAEMQKNFLPDGSCLALEAYQFSAAVPADNWKVLPGYGRTHSGVTYFPVTAAQASLSKKSPYLEYEFSLQDTGKVEFTFMVSPTLDFLNKGGLTYGVSVDQEQAQLVNINGQGGVGDGARSWERSVTNNIIEQKLKFNFSSPGKHLVKFWRTDPAVVLQKIIMDTGGLKPSYLGPAGLEERSAAGETRGHTLK